MVVQKNRPAMDGQFETRLGGDRAGGDADHDDCRRRGLTNVAETKRMHDAALNLLLEQVGIHSRTDDILPDVIKMMSTENCKLLRSEVGLRASRLHPDVGARARDHARPGREAAKITLGLDWRWDIRSNGRRNRSVRAGHAKKDIRDELVQEEVARTSQGLISWEETCDRFWAG
jgi:hypothetical protein